MSFGPQTLISMSMVSLEAEDVSGRTSAEIERVIYARVKNFDFLERAFGADRQEQWSVKVPKTDENAGSGSIRVRKVINLREPGAAVQYILASKLDVGSAGGTAETPEPSTVDQFNIFKYLANKGMLKDRYYFPIEGTDLQWEVDCFTKPGELYHEWVKVDLEKWPRGKELPQLPFAFVEVIDGSEGEITEENKPKIDNLYETIFLTKNTNQPLVNYNAEAAASAAPLDEEGQNKDNDPGAANGNANPDDAGNTDDTAGTGGDDTSGAAGGDGSGAGAKKDGSDAAEGGGAPEDDEAAAGKAKQGNDDQAGDAGSSGDAGQS